MNELKMESQWVLFSLADVVYAISSQAVMSINQICDSTPLPTAPKEIRGVINFRGKIIQLIDTRKLLDKKTVPQDIVDFSEMLNNRLKDHVNWIETLEKSVYDSTEFTLTTDPHKCAFGKWYDSFKLKDASIMFDSTFKKFDTPHKSIHNLGITARQMVDSGKTQEAIDLISSVKDTELKQMISLFDELKDAYKESLRETILVLGDEHKCAGITVDRIIAIENLTEIDENFLQESITNTQYLSGVAKDKHNNVVLLLNDEFILSKFK